MSRRLPRAANPANSYGLSTAHQSVRSLRHGEDLGTTVDRGLRPVASPGRATRPTTLPSWTSERS